MRLAWLLLVVVVVACDPPLPAPTEVEFDTGRVEGARFTQPTSIVFGSDGRLYVSEVLGSIYALTLSDDGKSVLDIEQITTDDDFEQVLGLAFDTMGPEPAIYVSHNYINQTGDGPLPNEIAKIHGEGFSEIDVVIWGLPVSGHNHGTNGLEFGPDGRLYISQGGATSSGAPAEPDNSRWLDWDETPLSGAILVADVNAPGFDGHVVYDRPEATSETNQISGDVHVWSPGHRNAFDLMFHSNGNMYSLDNGSSEPVPRSLDCDTLGPPPEDDPDQLNLVVEGEYYGHANRNRGRQDPSQCVNLSPFDETVDDGMLHLLPPSSDAIHEVHGPVFPDSWQGDLLYAWWSGGELRRVMLAEDGRTVEGEDIVLQDLGGPIAIAQHPDTGIVYVAEFGGGAITYIAGS